ncbi:MAG: T9SS type A sorting domain-containing protein [Chitinophagales bacterium]
MLSKLSIDQRTDQSNLVIQGKVTKQTACWNYDKTFIYTVNTVQVSDRIKGSAPDVVEIITQGGLIDGKLLTVEPSANLKVGTEGIFFLTPNRNALKFQSNNKQYEIYGMSQGFIEYDKFSGKYIGTFDEYQNSDKIYSLIQKKPVTTSNSREGKDNSTYDVAGGAQVTYFTPNTISAGTQSILTIMGFGFKEKTGQATVQFRNANSVLPNSFNPLPDSSYILSWTDTEIKVLVPGASAFGGGGSGNGLFRVIDKNGAIIESESSLSVSYNQFEYKKNKLILVDKNNKGGYTFTLNENLNSNTAAKNCFKRALDQWICKTGVNAEISENTTSNTCPNQLDDENTVSFASASCPLPPGALAVTYTSYSICDRNSPIFPESIDMMFSPDALFYFGTDNPASNQYDFESVALHELGHAFGEGHHSEGTEIMYPSISAGAVKRDLNQNSDITNVSDVINRSISTASCIYGKHIKSPYACTTQANSTPVKSQFTTDKIIGCAPLTVNFTDQSTGNPTEWKWDFTNDGTVESESQNASYTFTQAGVYSIKLVAYNATTKDSTIKQAFITVTPAINANIQLIKNVSCNNGNDGSLKVIPSGGDGNYTFQWNNNQQEQQLVNAAAGTYSVTIKDGNQCSISKTATITQPQALSLNVVTELINNRSYNATINVSGGTAPYTFLLNNSTELTVPKITDLNAGNYNLKVTDKNQCSESKTFSLDAVSPVNETEMQFDALNVYPNPARDNVNINFSLKDYKDVKVELYNLAGQTVYYNEFNNIKDQQTSIDLSQLMSGTYLLKFQLPEGNTFRKIVVSR